MEEFLEAALVLPHALASRCRWHGAAQQEEGPIQRDQPKLREPKQREQRLDTAFPSGQPQGGLQLCSEEGQWAIFCIGPDLTSEEHKSQFWSKRTTGNKAVL